MSDMQINGGIHLSVEVRVGAEQLAKWPPHLVKVFCEGIAQILYAQEQARLSQPKPPNATLASRPLVDWLLSQWALRRGRGVS